MKFVFHDFMYTEKELLSILTDVLFLPDYVMVIKAIADKDVKTIKDIIEGIEVVEWTIFLTLCHVVTIKQFLFLWRISDILILVERT